MNKSKVISREFKQEAIRLLEESRKPAAEVARELGIRRNHRIDMVETPSPGRGGIQ